MAYQKTTLTKLVENFDQLLEENRDDLIHVGTNYLTSNVKLLNKKIEKQISIKAPSSNLVLVNYCKEGQANTR